MSRLAAFPASKAPTLDDFCQDWRDAKRREETARAERLEAELHIAAMLPSDIESTASEKTGLYKVSVSYGLTRKVDADMLKAAWPSLKPEQQDAFRWKPEVSLTGLRKLEGQLYNEVAGMITATPAKPSVKVEVL